MTSDGAARKLLNGKTTRSVYMDTGCNLLWKMLHARVDPVGNIMFVACSVFGGVIFTNINFLGGYKGNLQICSIVTFVMLCYFVTHRGGTHGI